MVTKKKFTQTDLEKLIETIDKTHPQLLSLQIKGFCIWPTVKVVFWRFLTREFVEDESQRGNNSIISRNKLVRIKSYIVLLGKTFLSLVVGSLPNIKRFFYDRHKPFDVLIIHPNRVQSPTDGQMYDQFIGVISDLAQFNIASIHPTSSEQSIWETQTAAYLDLKFLNSLVVAIAIKNKILLKNQKQSSEIAASMHDILAQATDSKINLPKPLLEASIAHFLATMETYILVFKSLRPKKIFVIDFDSKFGEIAAAKSLGIPTYDIQHGTFWSHDLDHSWLESSAKFSKALPFPDYLTVRGKLWANIACELNFWKAERIIELGCACMSRYLPNRKLPADVNLSKKKLNVLFISGDIHVSKAYEFIFELLTEASQHLHVIIKLHPRETEGGHPLQKLAGLFKGSVTIKHNSIDIYQLILEADLVIGSNSTALIEAAALGTPTFSLGIGSKPEGLSAAHGHNKLLATILGYAANPQSLVRQILLLKQNPTQTFNWMSEVEQNINRIYRPDFSTNLRELIANGNTQSSDNIYSKL